MSSTTEAANKEVIERLTESFTNLDREVFDPCYADGIVVRTKNDDLGLDHDTQWSDVLGIFESFPNLEA